MSNTIWKKFELEIAKWMGTSRNMGSGRINSNDAGEPRPGDIVLPVSYSTLVELKTRKTYPKSGLYYRALDTLEEAKKENLDVWLHYERKLGSKQIYMLATSQEWMELITNFISRELKRRSNGDSI